MRKMILGESPRPCNTFALSHPASSIDYGSECEALSKKCFVNGKMRSICKDFGLFLLSSSIAKVVLMAGNGLIFFGDSQILKLPRSSSYFENFHSLYYLLWHRVSEIVALA